MERSTSRSLQWGCAVIVALGAVGCAGNVSGEGRGEDGARGSETGSAEAASRPPDPFETGLPEEQAIRQNTLVRRAIFEGNWLGSDVFARAMNTELANLNITAEFELEAMTPQTPAEGHVLLDGEVPDGSGDSGGEDTDGSSDPDSTGGSCAYAQSPADREASTVSCRFVVNRAMDTAFINRVQTMRNNPLPPEFRSEAPQPNEVEQWYEKAVDFSIERSTSIAVRSLREASVCDNEMTNIQSAFERGVDIGHRMMRTRVQQQEEQTPRTRCDTDAAIVNPARQQAMEAIPQAMDDNPLCEGYSAPDREAAANLESSREELREGIQRGIQEEANAQSARLVREWVCTPPQTGGGPGGGGGGGPGGGGGGGAGDPLVLDLNGDGVHVEPMRVGPTSNFGWGGKVQSEWTAPGDAFLVLDRNGNGQIETTELFGDVTLPQDGRIARDGFDALASYDSQAQGGNEDGRIDHQDEIFPALEVWDDRDGDAEVDDGELSTLREAGVAAIDIDRRMFIRHDGSEGVAADVLFDYRPIR